MALNMPGILPKVITHRLNIDPKYKPIHQKKKNFAPKRQKGIDEEVRKLFSSRFILEVHYLS